MIKFLEPLCNQILPYYYGHNITSSEMAEKVLYGVKEELNCFICLDTYTDPHTVFSSWCSISEVWDSVGTRFTRSPTVLCHRQGLTVGQISTAADTHTINFKGQECEANPRN